MARLQKKVTPGHQPEGQYGMPLVSIVAGTDENGRDIPFANKAQEGKRRSSAKIPEPKPADATDFTSRINRIATKHHRAQTAAPSELPATTVDHRQAEQLDLRLEDELKDQAIPRKPGKLPIKDEVITMDVPLFSLAKKPDRDIDVRVYVHGDQKVTIIPPQIGPATVFDKDLLIYAASLLVDAINRGETPSRTLDIDSKVFLAKTNRVDGRASYERIIAMLMRLQGTNIHTNIETGGVVQAKGFGLIESYEILAKKERTETPDYCLGMVLLQRDGT
jgi:hypothetical protein